ncbi:MAG TPA: tetratricopeptide repeat protein [Rickettsiales bacterium]|nr:tetratricopeptide repeat protein [Rickettsiales bacterium]
MLFKKQYLIIGIIAIAAVLASFLLIPHTKELALMEMKDKHFEEARTAYEKELSAGTLDMEVANNLSNLYLQKGDVNKAIEVIEKFVQAHPTDLDARTRLGTLYQYAQRSDDYLRNLEEINKLKPTSENLTTLSDIYNFKGEYDKQAQTLKELILTEKGKNPQHFVDLANIQASNHDYTNAIATLRDLQKTDPEHFTYQNELFLVSLLFDNKQPDEAAKAATEWVNTHENPEQAAELINMVHYRGNLAMGEALMGHFTEAQIDANPKLLEAYIYIEQSEGKDDDAYNRLKTLFEAKKLPQPLAGNLLLLAATRGDRKLANEVIQGVPLNTMQDTQVLSLIEIAITQRDSTLLAHISDNFRGEENEKQHPIVVAALAIANKSERAAMLLARLDTLGFSHEQTLRIAHICAHYKRVECTEHLLGNLPEQSKLTDSEVATVGDIYLQLHQYDKGADYLTKALETRKSVDIEKLLVQIDAARGRTKEVEAWVDAHPSEMNTRFLNDLYYSAYDNGRYNTAIRVAQIWRSKYNGGNAATGLIADASVRAGKYEDAVKILRGLPSMSRDEENNYLTALTKLSRRKPAYRKEMVDYATRKLSSGTAPRKQRLDILHALLDVNETDVAMPYIKDEALKSGGEWNTLYAELLDKRGRHDEARKFWLAALRESSPREQEDIAYVLLDNGYKDDAEPVFAKLALNPTLNAKDHNDVLAELLYIWGPRPEPDQMQWIEKRYQEASLQGKKYWASQIGNLGTEDYLIAFEERHPESITLSPEMAASYFDALADEGKMREKGAYFIANAKSTGNTDLLRKYAEVAQDRGFKRESRSAYETIVAIQPSDNSAVLDSGLSTFDLADYTSTKRYLDTYIKRNESAGGNDPQAYVAYFYYGEVTRRGGDLPSAQPYYLKTLALMDSNHVQDAPDTMSIRAQSQLWAGQKAEGLRTVDAAVKQYPQNMEMREALVEALMEDHEYGKARALLKKPLGANKQRTFVSVADIPGLTTPIKQYRLSKNKKKLLIRFAKHVKDADVEKLERLPWVSYVNDGYDAVLVVTLPEYKFHVNADELHSTTQAGSNDIRVAPVANH